MKLVPIPQKKYDNYRLELMFNAYKWDPQFVDSNTIAKYALVITKEEHKELASLTEKLDQETRQAEEFLNENIEFAKPLALPKKICNELKKMKNYNPKQHIRLMRYDFHQTVERKSVVSEVNSDVPGGFAESSLMPQIALEVIKDDKYWYKNFGDILLEALKSKIANNGSIMLVHCTSYSDDRQVMQFLGDKLKQLKYNVVY